MFTPEPLDSRWRHLHVVGLTLVLHLACDDGGGAEGGDPDVAADTAGDLAGSDTGALDLSPDAAEDLATASCGNGACVAPETWASCPDDCSCGNAFCEGHESFDDCPDDCPADCGNGDCDPDETVTNCPDDCPLGTFYCVETDERVDGVGVCDGNDDCADGSDEASHAWMCDGAARCTDDIDLLSCTDCVGTEWNRSCAGITVELVWTTPGDTDPADTGRSFDGADLDLYLRHPNAAEWNEACHPTDCGDESPWVCSGFNRQPNWGDVDNIQDNPDFLRDDVDGWGPETIVLREPEGAAGDAVVYGIGVRDYSNYSFGTSYATVTVFVDQVAVGRWTDEAMETGDFWHVADISWPSGRVHTVDVLYPAVPRENCENGTDDDGDGAIDCSDSDCGRSSACPLNCWLWEEDPGWTIAEGFQAVVIASESDAGAALQEPVALTFAAFPRLDARPILFVVDRAGQSIIGVNLVTGIKEVYVEPTHWPEDPPSLLSAIAWEGDELFDAGLYIADSVTAGDQDAVIYHLDLLGQLTVFTEAPGPGLDSISAMAFSPPTADPPGLYVAGDTNGDLVDWGVYDAAGQGADFSEVAGIAGMAFDRGGDFGGGLFAARPSEAGFAGDGTLTPINSEGMAGQPLISGVSGIHSVVMAPPGPFEGRMLAADWHEQTVLSISPSGDVETIASGLALTSDATQVLAISPDGNVLMVAEPSSGRVICVEPRVD